MTLPTQNPIPSSLKNDQLFNAEKIDQVVNSDDLQYTDRFGKKRFTFAGLYNVVQNWISSLSSSSGASTVYLGLAPISEQTQISIFKYMTSDDRNGIKSTVGYEVIVDYALKAAIDEGVMSVYFPPTKGVYVLGVDPVTLPIGFSLEGYCRRPYTVSGNTSFDGSGTVIRTATGKSFPFYSTQRHLFKNVNFDGRDGTGYLFYNSDTSVKFNGSRLEGCGIYRFAIGLGWTNYLATLFAFRCSISGNGDGIKNLIDSNVIGCVINANGRGVALLAGANNNSFIGVRNEWNTGDNYYAYQAVQNIINGELCDRAGRGGIVAGASSSWIVSNMVVRRCGSNQDITSNDSANFIIIDNGEIILSNVKTLSGVGDSGEGTLSPAYCVSIYGAGAGKFTATGCDLSGFVTKNLKNSNTSAIVTARANAGLPDTVNSGLSKSVDGRNISDIKTGVLESTAGTVLTLSLDNFAMSQYQIGLNRRILIEARTINDAQSGRHETIEIPVMTRCEASGSVGIFTDRVWSNSVTVGVDANATGMKVGISSGSSDNSIITITLTNVDGTYRRSVRATLLPF